MSLEIEIKNLNETLTTIVALLSSSKIKLADKKVDDNKVDDNKVDDNKVDESVEEKPKKSRKTMKPIKKIETLDEDQDEVQDQNSNEEENLDGMSASEAKAYYVNKIKNGVSRIKIKEIISDLGFESFSELKEEKDQDIIDEFVLAVSKL